MNASRCRWLTVAATICCILSVVDARFAVQGPVLTVTLKDPQLSASDSKWLDLSSIRPNAVMSLQSTSKPLPNWLPSLQSLRANVGYHYEELKRLPSYVESDVRFSNTHGDLQIQPSYEFRTKKASLILQASRGASHLMGRFTTKGERWLEMVRGCYQLDLPYASVGGVRITPSFDFRRNEPVCLLEATTGSQRTKAVLNLEYDNPTLSVVHALDNRHTIAPEISLYNAKIVYRWDIALDSGSIRSTVDPTSAIHVTWTDKSMTGKWVTDFRLPLEGASVSALAADLRVRRQFSF